jgi:thiol-disulfide isomerase/thioredoxin
MRNKLLGLFLMFMLLQLKSASAQTVKLLKVSELEARLKKGSDTLYVVNFWATWCAPCIKELPNFEQLAKNNTNQPLKVLLVSVDFKSKLESTVQPFVKKKGLQNEVYLLNETNQQYYIDKISKDWSGALPATLFVNSKKGARKLVEKELNYEELVKLYNTYK